ncbi:thermonuclease family protein [Rhodobacter sp. KR11]|uniref:thermonuclease family protein n=1 Tax=Rhodobacter sp. KR11 TaxID=2974588 RepID=UPI002223B0C7|nr:thermonuclease family protein [Rhodobacter sp. KR11]MCW1919794.1 thermonuclease family protein [Rhodobacter sp. KR11]
MTKVTDGDTLHMICDGAKHKVRLLGYDTPEIYSPKCASEKAMGLEATRLMEGLVAAGPVTGVTFKGQDRYGRDLAWVEVAGRDLTEVMLASGLAVVYVPKRKMDWCR